MRDYNKIEMLIWIKDEKEKCEEQLDRALENYIFWFGELEKEEEDGDFKKMYFEKVNWFRGQLSQAISNYSQLLHKLGNAGYHDEK